MRMSWDGYRDYYSPGPQAEPGTYSIENFRLNLDALLERLELTQEAAAKRCGVSQSVIAFWLNGQSTPNLYNFVALCDALKIEPNWLLSEHTKLK